MPNQIPSTRVPVLDDDGLMTRPWYRFMDAIPTAVIAPPMTTAEKNAMISPKTGLLVFDTSLKRLCVYTGTAWQTITGV
jgi:hypothetical protein